MKILPNEATKEKVDLGYKDVRTKYIDFVTKYNASKTAGTITLNAVELDALRRLNVMWKDATADSKCFYDMDEFHDQLNGKFSDTPEDIVGTAWNGYVKVFSDWLRVLLMSGATMFEVKI